MLINIFIVFISYKVWKFLTLITGIFYLVLALYGDVEKKKVFSIELKLSISWTAQLDIFFCLKF